MIFESIVTDAVVTLFESNYLIKEYLHGFWHGKSYLSNLLVLDKVTRCIDDRDNKCNLFDFAKSFDKVPHERLV